MKMIKDKELLVGADFAGFPLKEAVGRAPEGEGLEDYRRGRALP